MTQEFIITNDTILAAAYEILQRNHNSMQTDSLLKILRKFFNTPEHIIKNTLLLYRDQFEDNFGLMKIKGPMPLLNPMSLNVYNLIFDHPNGAYSPLSVNQAMPNIVSISDAKMALPNLFFHKKALMMCLRTVNGDIDYNIPPRFVAMRSDESAMNYLKGSSLVIYKFPDTKITQDEIIDNDPDATSEIQNFSLQW